MTESAAQLHPTAAICVSVRNAAEMLDVSISTVRRLVGRGALSALKVEGALRISVASIRAYVAHQQKAFETGHRENDDAA